MRPRRGVLPLMARITTISLDDTTVNIAKNIPNLSAFVRECLHRHHAQIMGNDACRNRDSQGEGWQKTGRCNPVNVTRPHCFPCWQFGKPRQEQISLFLQGGIQLEELDERTERDNWHLTQIPAAHYETKIVRKTPPLKTNLWQKLRLKFKYD